MEGWGGARTGRAVGGDLNVQRRGGVERVHTAQARVQHLSARNTRALGREAQPRRIAL